MKRKHALARWILRRIRRSAVHTDRRAKKAMRIMAKRRGLRRVALHAAAGVHTEAKAPENPPKREQTMDRIRKIARMTGFLRLTGGRKLHR